MKSVWDYLVELVKNPIFLEGMVIGVIWRCYVVFPGFRKFCKKLFD